MICKGCGGALERGERICRRCGREVPSLSDCGGFYDLVNTPRPAAEKPRSRGLGILCAVLAALLALSIVFCAHIVKQNENMARQLEEMAELLQEQPEAEATAGTETTVGEISE